MANPNDSPRELWSIGADLVEPSRLAQKMEANPGLAADLFTEAERSYCLEQFNPSQSFAARYCAKEAVIKALRIDGWSPLEIEILEGDPAPEVVLRGDLERRAVDLNVEVQVSLSHVSEMAMAVALVSPRGS